MRSFHWLKPRALLRGSAAAAALLIAFSPLATAAERGAKPKPSVSSSAKSARMTWWAQHGGFFYAGTDPALPAVFLIHGNHESAKDWTKPSVIQQHYDYRNHPNAKKLGKKNVPNAGIYKVAASPWLEVDDRNWVGFLRGRGYTVAGYSQSDGTIGKIMGEAHEAFDQFLKDTAALNPSSPPPVAIVAHSRGGLVARHLLKSMGSAGRVRSLITLHTPHQGSEMAAAPNRLADEAVETVGGEHLPEPFESELRNLVRGIASPLKRMIDDQSKELRPGSPMFQSLEQGEQPLEGVRYYTFGGTNPNYYRLYVWHFTPMSSVPQYSGLDQYFAWEVKPAEIGVASPMYASVKHFVPEITPGKGDGLVSDARSRLPAKFNAAHYTDKLNHAEVFWDRPLQSRVDQILRGGSVTPAASRASR